MTERNQDANHPATPARLMQAQRDGDCPKSHELAVAMQLLCGLAAVWLMVRMLIAGIGDFSKATWSQPSGWMSNSAAEFQSQLQESVSSMTVLLLPLLGIVFLGAVASHIVQSGAAAAFKKPLFQMQHVNPVTGAQRMYSSKSLTKGIIGLPKIAAVIFVSLSVAWYQRFELAKLPWNSVEQIADRLNYFLFTILVSGAATLVLVSGLDYILERFSFFQRHQMTDQELREENAMQGPDAQMTARRQQFYRNL